MSTIVRCLPSKLDVLANAIQGKDPFIVPEYISVSGPVDPYPLLEGVAELSAA